MQQLIGGERELFALFALRLAPALPPVADGDLEGMLDPLAHGHREQHNEDVADPWIDPRDMQAFGQMVIVDELIDVEVQQVQRVG